MSRASEITLFLIIVQASIGFVDAIDLFDQSYLSVPANNASYTLTDLEEYTAGQNPGVMDELLLMAQWAIEALMIGIKVILTVIFVLPMLINTFGVPLALAAFIQVGIYYIYGTWYAQFKSGRGWKQYE